MILDGGMGTELTRCGAKDVLQHRLWSAIVNINEPEIVVQAHSNFIDAGADIIVTNSYKTNVPMLIDALGFTEEEAIDGKSPFLEFYCILNLSQKQRRKRSTWHLMRLAMKTVRLWLPVALARCRLPPWLSSIQTSTRRSLPWPS